MTKETLDDIREVIGTLSVCMSYKSINNITSIPTYDLLHQVNILKKIVQKNIDHVVDGSRYVVVEESSLKVSPQCGHTSTSIEIVLIFIHSPVLYHLSQELLSKFCCYMRMLKFLPRRRFW